MEVAHQYSGSSSTWFLVELEFGNVGFLGEGKTRVPGEKPLGARERTNNKLNPHMASDPGIEPGPHWWEGSALTTTPPLLPSYIIVQIWKCKIPERVFLTEAICKRFSKVLRQWRCAAPCSFHLLYKQFSSLIEGGKIYEKKWGEKYPQHPLSSYSQTNQSNINLHVSKHINQSAPEGQILTLSSAWK